MSENKKITQEALSLYFMNTDRTLCLVGKLSNVDVDLFEGDISISEKQIYFSFDSMDISNGEQLVGIYADPEHWECVFDEFEGGVMGNSWMDKFKKFRNSQ